MTYNAFIQDILETRGRFGIPNGEYKERHHITPKCIGGGDDEDNLIDLYAHEHFIAHKLLAIENPDNYHLIMAWSMMAFPKGDTKRNFEISPDDYELFRVLSSKLQSEFAKKLWEDDEYRKAHEWSAEMRFNQSKTMKQLYVDGKINTEKQRKDASARMLGNNYGKKNKGKKRSKEFKDHLSDKFSGEGNPMYGKHHTKDTKKKLSEAASINSKGRKHWNNGIVNVFCSECPDGYVEGRLKFKDGSMTGKYEHKKGVKQKMFLWKTPEGTIVKMDKLNAHRWHKDWILLGEVLD